MDTPLLQTKLFVPPAPPGLLHRPRLFQQLDHALTVENGAILISTPAGYGKTTLLSSWLRTRQTPPVAWLTLEDEDSDPACFLTYLVAALETVQPEVGSHARNLLQTFHSQPTIQTVLAEIINGLAHADTPLLLVLDDYHAIQNQEIHHGVDFLLHHLPPHLHLVIASRVDPPWALARLRAQGRLDELRSSDLSFTLA
ncbi:MAG: hypothetical protein HC875_29615 [Anaerolineales bacterium]|nr:hypothetical protein [Anaerolineales bacterium]